jgi:pimeloyl-ACP methyl ester carboxylesterase
MRNPTPRTSRSLLRPRVVALLLSVFALLTASLAPAHSADDARTAAAKPTVVLVHGSWADASSWSGVIDKLHAEGYNVRAVPNPLRSLSGDAASVRAFLDTIRGPVILVGHSYGGAVITNAATGAPNVKALVYVNAFQPDAGESAVQLAGPDSALSADPTTIFDFVPATLPPTPATEVYLKRSTVYDSFAVGLSSTAKALIHATQRPATLAALNEPSSEPAWKTIPSWALIGTKDLIIPASAQRTMAARAGSKVTEYNAGHVGLMTNPAAVVRIIERAANAS